jgi:hypothetical protein
MARGWESKSVEGQMEAFSSQERSPKERPSEEELERERQRESLLLSRKRVIHDIEASRSPRHREILEQSLAYLEGKLAELQNK